MQESQYKPSTLVVDCVSWFLTHGHLLPRVWNGIVMIKLGHLQALIAEIIEEPLLCDHL
jgi:hypothetical protein